MMRYVILHHLPGPRSDCQGAHWDFMLEGAEGLQTWALESEPQVDSPINARSLPIHRTAYLDYEGPVSGDRGTVAQWDRGTYQWSLKASGRQDHSDFTGVLRGTRGLTRFQIRRTAEAHRWVVRFFAETPMDTRCT